jgi:hypothetical protein
MKIAQAWNHERVTKMDLSDLLVALKPATRKATQVWTEHVLRKAPYFGGVTLLSPDENRLSAVLCDLLNPEGTHGQGSNFLQLFVKKCAFGPASTISSRVTVRRECCTIFIKNVKRRIDILVDGVSWGIGIENKAWATEQKKQFPDYVEDLQKRYNGAFLLLRLAGDDSEVRTLDSETSKRLLKSGQFQTWTFSKEVDDWLAACCYICRARRVSQFLQELRWYIGSNFIDKPDPQKAMVQKHILSELNRLLAKDADNVRALAAIAESFPEIREGWVKEIFKTVKRRLIAKLGDGWQFEQSDGLFVEDPWAFFMMWHKSWKNVYRVRLESQPRYGYVALGVWRDTKHGLTRDLEIQQQLKRLGWGEKNGGPYWEALSPLPAPFRNWASSEGTVALREKRTALVELLTSEFVRMGLALQKPLADRVRKM